LRSALRARYRRWIRRNRRSELFGGPRWGRARFRGAEYRCGLRVCAQRSVAAARARLGHGAGLGSGADFGSGRSAAGFGSGRSRLRSWLEAGLPHAGARTLRASAGARLNTAGRCHGSCALERVGGHESDPTSGRSPPSPRADRFRAVLVAREARRQNTYR